MLRSALAALAVTAAWIGAPATAATPAPDCQGPPGDPPPDTAAWHQREQANDYCGEQRFWDTSTNPAYQDGVHEQLRPAARRDALSALQPLLVPRPSR